MQFQFNILWMFLVMLNILIWKSSAWLIFGRSTSDQSNSIEINEIKSGSVSDKYIAGMGLSELGILRPPSHDTPPSRCRCSCGEINYNARIIGGKETKPNVYPWMARLSYFNKFFCGGTLINDRYVLSAAHCVKGYMWFLIKVTFGEHDQCNANSKPEARYVLRATSRPFNFGNYNDDISLLRLNDRVPINEIIRPICLPNRRSSHYAGLEGIIAGWGTTQEDGTPSCKLRDVKIPIITNLECVEMTNYASGMITENMMCAGYLKGEKDSCQGDSGGPLMFRRDDGRHEIAGIVSWGIGCAQANYPGVYTRVTRYLSWIRRNTRDACYCQN